MPTRHAWLVLAAAAASALAGRAFGILELFALAAGLVALPAIAVATTAVRRPRVELRRLVRPRHPTVGEPAQAELTVIARSRTPTVSLWEPVERSGGAAVRITPMRAGEVTTATYRLPTERRGSIRLGPTSIEVSDPFDLACLAFEVAPAHEVIVYPQWQLVDLPATAAGTGLLNQVLRRRALGRVHAEEFHALRDYTPGDDLRRVHWRQSARRGDLVVRETDPSPRVSLTVVHDLRANQYTHRGFERSVSAVASLAGSAVHHRRPLRLLATDHDEQLVDELHLPDVMRHLALVEPSAGRLPPPRRRFGDGLHVVVVVGGAIDAARAATLARSAGGAEVGVAVCCERGAQIPPGWLQVDASVDGGFAHGWALLVGATPSPVGVPG